MHLALISLSEIDPPSRPVRADIDEAGILELAQSIRAVGLLQPIAVKRVDDRFEIVHGHRRYLAAIQANLGAVQCLVRGAKDSPSDAAKLHENLYRAELSPVEEAAFFAELFEEFGKDVDKVCDAVRQSRNYVETRLNILSGDPRILNALAQKKVSMGAALELNKLTREFDRGYYLDWAIRQGTNVATVRNWVRDANAIAAAAAGNPKIAEAVRAKEEAGPPPMVCFVCRDVEPRWDNEFWYVHRSCRIMVERAQDRKEGAINDGTGSTGIIGEGESA